MSDLATLKLACLAGGNIFMLDDPQDVTRAEQSGAVGIGLKQPTLAGYRQLIKGCSVNIVTDTQHLPLFEEACKGEDRPCLVLSDPRTPMQSPNHSPLTRVGNEEELQQAIDKGSLLIAAGDIDLFRRARSQVKDALVFFEGRNAKAMQQAAAVGNDGCIYDGFLPSEAELEKSAREKLSSHTDFQKKDGELLIGVMALQGDYVLHKKEFDALNVPGVRTVLVHSREELAQVDALVLPGGWSNLQSRYFSFNAGQETLGQAVQEFAREKPVLAVCAGMILAGSEGGKDCEGRDLLSLIHGRIDNNELNGPHNIIIRRNGRNEREEAMFSDGPVISGLSDDDVIARLESDGEKVVMAQSGNVMVSATHANGIHRMFMDQVMRKYGRAHAAGLTSGGAAQAR